jgi:uncharacterized protein YgiM (DUF1202 family)
MKLASCEVYMKKIVFISGLCLCIAFSAAAQVSKGGTLYTAAKNVALKSSTGFFASNKGTLAYGEQVTVLQVSGKWVEVRSAANPSVSGWTASSNMTAKRIVAAANAGSASAREVALAGKGFNQEVENVYKAKGALNYADVDKTEKMAVSQDDLYRFVVDGHLSQGD